LGNRNVSHTLIEVGSLFNDFDDSSEGLLNRKQLLSEDKYELFPPEFIDKYFPEYKLNSDDLLLIAAVWYKYIIDRNRTLDSLGVLEMVYGKEKDIITGLNQIIRLIKKNVFYTMKKIIANLPFNITQDNTPPVEITKHSLLENEICIHRSFAKVLLGEENRAIADLNTPYKSNKEFLNDWFAYINVLYEFSSWSFDMRNLGDEMDEEPTNEYLKAMEWKTRLTSKMSHTTEIFPLQDVIEEYNLDEKEQIILMYLVKTEMDGDGNTDIEDTIKLISTNRQEMYQNNSYLTHDSKLVQQGLVEISSNVFFRTRGSDVRVSPDITRRIIMKKSVNDEDRLVQVLKGNDIFTLLSPSHTFNDLILPAEMKKTIHSGISRYKCRVDNILQEWGLFEGGMTVPGSYKKKIEPGLLMLFHGPPGTGKTFAAGAIAESLSKQLLVTDISRLQSKWVGDSEKNVRRLFTTFEKVVRRTDNPPVLLLNEADQFLTRRLNTTGSAVDVMYNSLQNLFLEAFEQLKGILIATTNLKTNLDEAFSRRFHLKLEFTTPGPKERQALWKLHLPESIPGAGSIDIPALANDYSLSGGQIQIIVKNAATEAAVRSRSKRKLLQQDLVKFCELEKLSEFDTNMKDIGFRA